jgi:anti-sigma factor RsiW
LGPEAVLFKGESAVVISCEQVWLEISNYLDGETDPNLQAEMDRHLRECRRCAAVLDGTRNVVQLYGDERMIELPQGFSQRLHQSLNANMTGGRRSFLGWIVAAAAAAVAGGTFEAGRSFSFGRPELRSEHAQTGAVVPPDIIVVVSAEGKIFHVPGCRFIHDKATSRMIAAREALGEGYTPCVRCMKQFLQA